MTDITYKCNTRNLKRILADIFGKDSVPVVAKRRNRVDLVQDFDQLNADHQTGSAHVSY